jgi:hypothetical protein
VVGSGRVCAAAGAASTSIIPVNARIIPSNYRCSQLVTYAANTRAARGLMACPPPRDPI